MIYLQNLPVSMCISFFKLPVRTMSFNSTVGEFNFMLSMICLVRKMCSRCYCSRNTDSWSFIWPVRRASVHFSQDHFRGIFLDQVWLGIWLAVYSEVPCSFSSSRSMVCGTSKLFQVDRVGSYHCLSIWSTSTLYLSLGMQKRSSSQPPLPFLPLFLSRGNNCTWCAHLPHVTFTPVLIADSLSCSSRLFHLSHLPFRRSPIHHPHI